MLFLHLSLGSALAAPPVPTARPVLPSGETYDPTRSFAPLVEAVQPAVVTIEVTAERGSDELLEALGFDPEEDLGPSGAGSGFIIDPRGWLLTNAHVLAEAESFEIVLHDGTRVQAEIVGQDEAMDIALLELKGRERWPAVKLGDSDAVRVGDWVLAMGNALGLGSTATFGIISGKGRVIGHDVFGREAFLQTDAAINQGNSGGPLFDLSGRVVGMNTAIIANANTVGFSIPSNLIASVLPDLRKHGRVFRGFLGVRPQSLTNELRKSNAIKTKNGALVTRVFEGTPAAKGGLELGDVITAVDGVDVADEDALIVAIANRRPGDRVELRIERKGKARTLKITLTERPEPQRTEPAPEVGPETKVFRFSGVVFGPLPEALSQEQPGLLVIRGVPAAPKGELQTGDIVIAAAGQTVTEPTDLARVLLKAEDDIDLVVIRDGKRRKARLPVD